MPSCPKCRHSSINCRPRRTLSKRWRALQRKLDCRFGCSWLELLLSPQVSRLFYHNNTYKLGGISAALKIRPFVFVIAIREPKKYTPRLPRRMIFFFLSRLRRITFRLQHDSRKNNLSHNYNYPCFRLSLRRGAF
jgi:hypothetical protein